MGQKYSVLSVEWVIVAARKKTTMLPPSKLYQSRLYFKTNSAKCPQFQYSEPLAFGQPSRGKASNCLISLVPDHLPPPVLW
ncbi:hypothetical protein RRG08_011957 [Elysia crispata]|uniref:Uncharacterized protein n=1 Tax=Elysia crispata TaxID=231223 RepID=A0AAE1E3Y0_9GAST|nr:hypothetical protein RRG08_011957 [Elysia crispata]